MLAFISYMDLVRADILYVDYGRLLAFAHDCTTSPSTSLLEAPSYIIPIITCREGEFRKLNFILSVELKYDR